MTINPFEKKKEPEVTTALDKPDETVIDETVEVTEKQYKELEKRVETKKSRKQQILDQYGGLESNVPINSPYWKLKN